MRHARLRRRDRSVGRRLRRRSMGRPGGVCERDVVQSLRHAGRGKRALERRGERPETGASDGSAAADHGAERRDGHGAGHSAHLPDTAERQTAGDGVSRRVHGRGIVRLQRRADDGGPDGPCDDGTGAAGPAGRGGGDPKPGKLSGGGQGRERSRRPGRDAEQGREAGTRSGRPRNRRRGRGCKREGRKRAGGSGQQRRAAKAGGESGRQAGGRRAAKPAKYGRRDEKWGS